MRINYILTPIDTLYGAGTHCHSYTDTTAGTMEGDQVHAVAQQISEDKDGDYTGLAVVGVANNGEGVWQYSRGTWNNDAMGDDHNSSGKRLHFFKWKCMKI